MGVVGRSPFALQPAKLSSLTLSDLFCKLICIPSTCCFYDYVLCGISDLNIILYWPVGGRVSVVVVYITG